MMDIEVTLAALTLEEKARLCSGAGFNATYDAGGKVPSLNLVDGPAGVRRQGANQDMFGTFVSNPATCFPSGATLAEGWDPELTAEVGAAIGEECRDQGVDVILGPSNNIKRSPLCGRNFEYYSEDPLLAGKLAAGYVRGVQSKGVGACVKHFAANSQETNRFTVDARVDERTLREIYLTNFEIAIKEGRPWSLMGAYNRLNGEHCCGNKWLLADVLRDDWGFDGIVISDWSGVWDRVKSIEAGLDLQMPYCGDDYIKAVIEAVENGSLDEEVLDETVRRILKIANKAVAGRSVPVSCDYEAHHVLARRAAGESAVLLRNRGGVLPLATGVKVALIGGLAKNVRIQGGGSSNVNPTKTPSLVEAMEAAGMDFSFARGYRVKKDVVDESMAAEALDVARQSDVVIYAAGLPSFGESEGYDRKGLGIPVNQITLLEGLKALGKPVVVLLFAGAPVAGDWLDLPDALLAMYCSGQGQSEAAVDLLTGKLNPCGKLAETWPIKLADTPYSLSYPRPDVDNYAEGVFVGYRYYEAKGMPVRFPFGYGLSYTTFSYANLRLSSDMIDDTGSIEASVDVTNTGKVAGKEIVEFYVAPPVCAVPRPAKELKAFVKVMLEPGETKTVAVMLDKRAFAYWSETTHDWRAESGEYMVMAGPSSEGVFVGAPIEITETNLSRPLFTEESTIRQISTDLKGAQVISAMMSQAGGEQVAAAISKLGPAELDDEDAASASPFDAMEMSMDMPLAKIADMSSGAFPREAVHHLLASLNE